MRPIAGAVLLLLAGCDRSGEAGAADPRGGQALEQAARTADLVPDPARVSPVGVFVADGDRVCVVPKGRDAEDGYRLGASVDYGEGQRCTARGAATGRSTMAVDFGSGCRFDAQSDGDRLVFPSVLPASCETVCEGRATLAALRVERLSDAAAEASRLRGADGKLLCAD
ncbi:hypothetical protein [Sphingomonas adhaesiva]|uniref:hypothetical protein n=1 Tax=Sphingomonas adhaesiva TaxID=28212 RepID=UPI002FFD1776